MCTFIVLKGGYKAISYVCILRPTHSYSLFPGTSGLVYCGYLVGGGDRDIVAIKTCKGSYIYYIYHILARSQQRCIIIIVCFSYSSVACK